MATRFYLPASGTAPLGSLTVQSDWELSTGLTRLPCSITKSGTSLADDTKTWGSASTQQWCWRQYQSNRLSQSHNWTTSDTVSMVIRCIEGNAACDSHLAYIVKVVSGDGATVRGVVGLYHATSTEFGTSVLTRIHNARTNGATNFTSYPGDRIVIEIGLHGVTPSTSYSQTMRFGDPSGTSDFALTAGLSTDLCPWVELSRDVVVGDNYIGGVSNGVASCSATISAKVAISGTSTGGGGSASPVTDDLESYSTGALAGQGNWSQVLNTISIVDVSGNNKVKSDTADTDTCVRLTSPAFSNNHRVKIVLDTLVSGGYIGPAVRCSGSGATACFYVWIASTVGSGAWLSVVVNGTVYEIASGGGNWQDGDDLELKIEGSTITCYLNGSVDTQMGSATSPATGNAGVYSDTRLTSGSPGIAGYDNAASYGDSFEANDLAPASVSGTLIAKYYLYGDDINGIASCSGTLTSQTGGGAVSGVTSGVASCSGTLNAKGRLYGVASGIVLVSGTIQSLSSGPISGVTSGVASVSGTLISGAISGSSLGVSMVSGAILSHGMLYGVISGVTSIVGILKGKGVLSGISGSNPIIADHTVVSKYNTIPQVYIDEIKKMWVSIAGESHSEAYRNGCELLEALDSKFQVNVTESGTPEAYTTSHLRISRATWGDRTNSSGWIYDYGEEDWFTNATAISRTKAGLLYCKDNGPTLSVLGFGWCYDACYPGVAGTSDPIYYTQWGGETVGSPEGDSLPWGLDDDDQTLTGNSVSMDTYINATKGFIKYCKDNSIPTKVIFTTGPVDDNYMAGLNEDEVGYQQYLKWKKIRDVVAKLSDVYLFDYADILCYNDSNSLQTTQWTDDNSTLQTFPIIHDDNYGGSYVAHIGTVGALRLGKAMWWMLAKMAGWREDVSGTLTAATSLHGTVSGVSTCSATIHAHGILYGAITGVTTCSGTLRVENFIQASVTGVTTVSGTLIGDGRLIGQINGVATLLAAIIADGILVGQIGSVASISSNLKAKGRLIATSNGIATLVATINANGKLYGTISGVSTCSGYVAQQYVGLKGIINSYTIVSGILKAKGELLSSIFPITSISAILKAKGGLLGQSFGTTAIQSHLIGKVYAYGIVNGITSDLGNLKANGRLGGVIDDTSIVSGIILARGSLTGSIITVPDISGRLLGYGELVSIINNTSLVLGTIREYIPPTDLFGVSNGLSIVSGTIIDLSTLILEFGGNIEVLNVKGELISGIIKVRAIDGSIKVKIE